MLSRALAACLLALSLCGCGAATSPATGTVTGHVQVRACGGAYRTDLKPGTYIVQVMEGSVKRDLAGPRTVTVVAGKTLTADFIYTIQLL